MAYSIHQHLAYNTWANAKFAAVLGAVDDKIYFQANTAVFIQSRKLSCTYGVPRLFG